MSWNHRLVRRTDPDGTVTVAIHEVYYDAGGEPTSCTVDAVSPLGSSDDGDPVMTLAAEMGQMLRAFASPVLEYDKIGGNITLSPKG